MTQTRRYRWTLSLASPPHALWPFVADTDRFNRDTGVPAVTNTDATSEAETPLARPLSLRIAGQTIEWLEEPFEWVEPTTFSIVRRYTHGPLLRMDVRLTLRPEGAGTLLTYEVEATPKGLLGMLAIPIQIGLISRRAFMRTFRAYDAAARRELRTPPPPLPAGEHETNRTALHDRLTAYLASADDESLARIRPRVLAKEWGTSPSDTLAHMLHATRAGLLDLRWDLLCPLCRGSKASSSTLAELPAGVHCDACHIDVTANLERLVELTFRPNPAVRAIEPRAYCIGGPRVTPHIIAQQLLAPGESRRINLNLVPGPHRLRSKTGLNPEIDRAAAMIRCEPGVPRSQSLDHTAYPRDEIRLAPEAEVTITNSADRPRLFMLERMDWADDAVTASEVFALQVFRDLFSREALRPGEQVSVGSITLLFTDLKDSTRLYEEIGDAPAFGRVMSHFDVLKDAVAQHHGAIVKTMGDAIMAVFTKPADAVAAAFAMHAGLRNDPTPTSQRSFAHVDTSSLRLKSAIHTGPCIAVTLNERLDYFGSTVNIAARLVGLSHGGDIILSDTVRNAEAVNTLLAPRSTSIEGIEETLKGFDHQRFTAWRIQV